MSRSAKKAGLPMRTVRPATVPSTPRPATATKCSASATDWPRASASRTVARAR